MNSGSSARRFGSRGASQNDRSPEKLTLPFYFVAVRQARSLAYLERLDLPPGACQMGPTQPVLNVASIPASMVR